MESPDMLETVQLSNARSEFSRLYDEAVERAHPIIIHRRGDADAVLFSREQLAQILAPYVAHVHVAPEEEGGFTLWIDELKIAEYGETLLAAHDALLASVRSYVRDYFNNYDFYCRFIDLAAELPYVTRLSLARDERELKRLLFGPMRAATETSAPAPPESP
jgi:hypothetical protein